MYSELPYSPYCPTCDSLGAATDALSRIELRAKTVAFASDEPLHSRQMKRVRLETSEAIDAVHGEASTPFSSAARKRESLRRNLNASMGASVLMVAISTMHTGRTFGKAGGLFITTAESQGAFHR
ncbi:hypothetical protein SAMN05216558_3244 [Pseudomonas vancouverensis]|nr:hypothetical protein SAMN05216558_3244 [Pseudomonas vancouverensis]